MCLFKSVTIVLMLIITYIILFILYKIHRIKAKQLIGLCSSFLLFIVYLNNLYPELPIQRMYNYKWSEFLTFGQFLLMKDYILSLDFNYFISNYILPSLFFIAIGIINSIVLNSHKRLRGALIFSGSLSLTLVIYPLTLNLIYNGVVWAIDTGFIYISFLFYMVGYFLTKLIRKVQPNSNHIKGEL